MARNQVVYCHNPSPFYKIGLFEAFISPSLALFSYFYIFLYGINIKKNKYIVVQQDWIRKRFLEKFGNLNILVAHPRLKIADQKVVNNSKKSDKFIVFYPTLPRSFKNVEVVMSAMNEIRRAGYDKIEFQVTISGAENRYAKLLKQRFSCNPQIKFIGRLSHEEVLMKYRESDLIVFPSKLETWGLPLSEAMYFEKNIIVSDLEYSNEVIGDYPRARFLKPDKYMDWAMSIEQAYLGNFIANIRKKIAIREPFFADWRSLIIFLTTGGER